MRKFVAMLLVLVVVASFVVAFAADSPSQGGKPAATPTGTSPKTGEVVNMTAVVSAVALLGAAGVCYVQGKKVED